MANYKSLKRSEIYSTLPDDKKEIIASWVKLNRDIYWDTNNPRWVAPKPQKLGFSNPPFDLTGEWYSPEEALKRGLKVALDVGKTAVNVAKSAVSGDYASAAREGIELGKQVKNVSGRGVKKTTKKKGGSFQSGVKTNKAFEKKLTKGGCRMCGLCGGTTHIASNKKYHP